MRKLFTACVALSLCGSPLGYAGETSKTAKFSIENTALEIFKPKPSTKTTLNHDVWDAFLQKVVLNTGQSNRQFAPDRTPFTGTRLTFGHTSKLRLEGNKVYFSKFTSAHQNAVKEYRQGLEDIANSYDITAFPKKEQLAFWINLHNAALVEAIAENYPLKRPSKLVIKEQGLSLHDAKLTIIKNVPLSLKDIREKIVYPNWADPKVMYGFSLGDIGSPSIQPVAYNAKNIDEILSQSAGEFTNSLRGYRHGKFSKIYEQNAQFYFPNFKDDLSLHLKTYMRGAVQEELSQHGIVKSASYDNNIIDLTFGSGDGASFSNLTVVKGPFFGDGVAVPFQGSSSLSPDQKDIVGEFSEEIKLKRRDVKQMKLGTDGTVIIEDLPAENDD